MAVSPPYSVWVRREASPPSFKGRSISRIQRTELHELFLAAPREIRTLSSHINKPGVNLHVLLRFQVPDRNIGHQHVRFTVFKRARQFSVEQLELSVIGIPLNLDQNHKTLLETKKSSEPRGLKTSSSTTGTPLCR